MKAVRTLALGCVIASAVLSAPALGVVEVVPVTVPGSANIYGAGHVVAPAPGGGGAGVLPTEVALPPGAQRIVRLTSVTGNVDFGGCCAPNGPDGVPSLGQGPSNSWDGIGGMTVARGRFLSAVFLDDSEPSDPPPAPLAIPDIGFTTLSPGLRQCFFVGDGFSGTGAGDQQVIQVPQGATRLFLGLHDAGPPDHSLPGWYGDNSGGITGNVEIGAMRELPSLGLAARLVLVVTLVLSIAASSPLRRGSVAG